MKIDRLILGPLDTNCYIVSNNNECYIIDPASDSEKIIKEVGIKKVKGILVTHYHFDHIGALNQLETYYGIKANQPVKDFLVIPTKGHTSDSVCFISKLDKVIFCGDFLFEGSYGRTDLETGSNSDMINSIRYICNYDDDYILYPGHGNNTTLGNEKANFKSYIDSLI